MPSTILTINTLQTDFPQFHFKASDVFLWSATTNTVYVDTSVKNSQASILHELSHAILGHTGYERDIELLKLERDAWEYAKLTLAPRYNFLISEETIQDSLDTYRRWLHARSTCPECEAIGVQARSLQYKCISCSHTWRVNDARICALRRYSLQTKSPL